MTFLFRLRHQIVLAADAEQVLKALMLIGVASAAEGELIAATFALPRDPLKMLYGHVGLLYQHTALITADTRLGAESGLSVNAVPHHADVDQMRKRRHKRINARVVTVLA